MICIKLIYVIFSDVGLVNTEDPDGMFDALLWFQASFGVMSRLFD